MPRQHVNSVPVVSASPAMVAAMLNVQPRDLADAVAKGQITVYTRGTRRRIILEDALNWMRTTWPKYEPRKSTDGVSHHAHA